jgi:hypothetical protein
MNKKGGFRDDQGLSQPALMMLISLILFCFAMDACYFSAEESEHAAFWLENQSKLELISGENLIADSIDFVIKTRSKLLLGAVFVHFRFLRFVPLILIILLVFFPAFLSDLYLSSYIRF